MIRPIGFLLEIESVHRLRLRSVGNPGEEARHRESEVTSVFIITQTPPRHVGLGLQLALQVRRVVVAEPDHLGANHYYIHAVEEHFPKRAEPAADRLGGLAPGAGHLVHMPSHIYWRVGRYDDAMEINQRAAAADEEFFAFCRAGAFYRAAYYNDKLGRGKEALEIVLTIDEDLLGKKELDWRKRIIETNQKKK